MSRHEHTYSCRLLWEGNRGAGTASYEGYGREYRVFVDGKPPLLGSANPAFRGVADRHDPEDLFLAAIASCHMLTYLALCARQRIEVVAYEDHPVGILQLDPGGGGRFAEVVLQPRVTVAGAGHVDRATQLHDRAQQLCFIARSCSVPIRHRPEVRA